MMYVRSTPWETGAYPPPESNPFPGAIPLTDEQVDLLVQYDGFITITSSEEKYEEGFFRTVYTVEPNLEAWEKWKASDQSDPEVIPPTKEEQLRADVDYLALMTGVDLV